MTLHRTKRYYFAEGFCSDCPDGILDENGNCEYCDLCKNCGRELNDFALCDICDINKFCISCCRYLGEDGVCPICSYCPKHPKVELIMNDCPSCSPKEFCGKCNQLIGAYFNKKKFCDKCYRRKKCMFCQKKSITKQGECENCEKRPSKIFFNSLIKNTENIQTS